MLSKKRFWQTGIIFPVIMLLITNLACATSPTTEPVSDEPQATVEIVETVETVNNEISEASAATADLAHATVQILAMNDYGDQWETIWTGSGSIISASGLILTNAHVVDDRYDDYTDLGVAITDRTDTPPQLSYLAEIAAVDYGLDLAVIRIRWDSMGNPVQPDLPFVEVGKSSNIEIGDRIRILGYPGIGSDTITFTEGAVSGFTSERGLDGRAWIKTDATIAGGSSGGMAVNDRGELVGVPTRASVGDQDQIVDCRAVADTNRDGYIDDNDTCVPIGGYINGLRPVDLAASLIQIAESGGDYVSGELPPPVSGEQLSEDVRFENLVFSDGVTAEDTPLQFWYALPDESTQLCAFWDYSGMYEGMSWSAYWFINGELNEDGSFLENAWGGAGSGNWWVCIGGDAGLRYGLYELVLEADGETRITDSIYVGGNRGVADFTIRNNSPTEQICFVQISPSEASNWGQDELGSQEIIEPGMERTITLATGEYDLLLSNCDMDMLVEEYTIHIDGDYLFEYQE